MAGPFLIAKDDDVDTVDDQRLDQELLIEKIAEIVNQGGRHHLPWVGILRPQPDRAYLDFTIPKVELDRFYSGTFNSHLLQLGCDQIARQRRGEEKNDQQCRQYETGHDPTRPQEAFVVSVPGSR
jgi:hypothetical protein